MPKTVFPLPRPDLADEGTFSGPVAFSNGVAVSGGTLLFVSGQLAFDAQMNLVGKGDMGAQTRKVLDNIKAVVEGAGGKFDDIIRVTVYVSDITRFREIHDARLEYFRQGNLPASTMIEVSGFVHPDALIEIEAIAQIGG